VSWAIWWPVALMAAIMLADVGAVVASAILQRRIGEGRAALRASAEAHELQQAARLRELRAAIAVSDDARRACDAAREAMEAEHARLQALLGQHRAACAEAFEGNVVRLPVVTLADVAASAAAGADAGREG
jgi:hypothetical protein